MTGNHTWLAGLWKFKIENKLGTIEIDLLNLKSELRVNRLIANVMVGRYAGTGELRTNGSFQSQSA